MPITRKNVISKKVIDNNSLIMTKGKKVINVKQGWVKPIFFKRLNCSYT